MCSVLCFLIVLRLGVLFVIVGKVKVRFNKFVSKVLMLNWFKCCLNNCIRVFFLFCVFFCVMVSVIVCLVYVLVKLIMLIELGLIIDRLLWCWIRF